MKFIILFSFVAFVTTLVAGRNINNHNEAKRLLGLPSLSEIRERIRDKIDEGIDKIQDKVINTIVEGGDLAYDVLERILENEKIKPYAEKLRMIIYDLKDVVEASEFEWGQLRDRLVGHARDLFAMFMAEDEVKAAVQKIETIIDEARDAAQTSKDKANAVLKKVRTFVWSVVLRAAIPVDMMIGSIFGKRGLEYIDINNRLLEKRFLPSISDIRETISGIKETVGGIISGVKDKVFEKLLAGGEVAYDILEKVLMNERIKPYAQRLKLILYDLKEIAEVGERRWIQLRTNILTDFKDLFEMFMAEDKVQAVLQKVAERLDQAREAAKISKEAAKTIYESIKTLLWAGVLAVGAPVDLVVGGVAGKVFETIMG